MAANSKLPISCFIISMNEADRIHRTIASVIDFVDDIVVVDSGSTDGTQDVAREAGARVVYNAWPGFGQQKRFGEEQCRHDWVLNLDADEVVVSDLALEIRQLFSSGRSPDVAGFWVNDLVVYPGASQPRPFARDHRFIRLYDRRKIRFADSTLFDNVEPKNEALGRLRHPLHHYSVRSFEDLIVKSNERATYNARNTKSKPRSLLAVRMVTELPMQFLKYYFWRTHVFGGVRGLQYARILAFYRYVRILRMWEGSLTSVAPLNSQRPRSSTAVRPETSALDRS